MSNKKISWKFHPASVFKSRQSMQQDWNQLNSERGDLPFLSSNAICAALTEFSSGHERLAIAEDKHGIVAMLVLTQSGFLQWATFQPSQMPLGAWVARRDQCLSALTQSLVRAPINPLRLCLGLSITQIDPLICPRPDDAVDYRSNDYIDTAWVEIKGSFEDYWAARGKNLRQNMRKQRNKLAADGIRTQMRVLSERTEIGPALTRYGALESSGWKANKGTAIHPENAQGRFYLKLFEQAASLGEAVIYEYLFDDKTVAMNLCLLRNRQLIVLKTTYDETVNKALSPAFLLREEELQAFFAEGKVDRVEYFGKVMDWHTKLTQEKRGIFHFTQYRWQWLRAFAEHRNTTKKPEIISAATQS